MFAIRELWLTLADSWQQADLAGHLRAWWWTVTHRDLIDGGEVQCSTGESLESCPSRCS